MSLGLLKVEVVEAHLTHDTDFWTKMDPFVKMQIREQTWNSAVCKSGGKKPHWINQIFPIDVKYFGDDLTMDVRDEDMCGSDNIG